jgi:hypothetical protein
MANRDKEVYFAKLAEQAERYDEMGNADIVFLLDGTGSMEKAIEGLKENINTFVDSLNDPQSTLKDWRSKVVTYRDYEADDTNWYEDNPFVADAAALKSQIAAVTVTGGLDEPESLLDALHKLVSNQPTGPAGQVVDPNAWRARGSAARVVVVFTDASFHETMVYPEGAGGTVADVVDLMMTQRMKVYVFAPDLDGYADLELMDGLVWYPMAEPFIESLAAYSSDQENFQEILRAMAKTISQSAAVETEEL